MGKLWPWEDKKALGDSERPGYPGFAPHVCGFLRVGKII